LAALARTWSAANPSDLPVQTPAELKLTVNLKTAKALGGCDPLGDLDSPSIERQGDCLQCAREGIERNPEGTHR
jgi:hypothetical protein